MAYNSNSAYQPPARAYYGHQQQQAPAQPSYHPQPQDPYSGYDQGGYDQGYDQGYAQGHAYDAQGAYGQEQHQSYDQGYGNGYDGGYQQQQQPQPQQQAPQYANRAPPPAERSYDPRYQQRPARGAHPGAGQHGDHMAPQSHQPRQPHPRDQYPPQDQHRQQRETYEQQGPDVRPPPQVQGGGARPRTAPQTQPEKPKKTTMEEWKAKEKAKFHVEAPETRAQDNAFPIFPTKKEKETSRPNTRSGPTNGRPSEETARPPTSGSHRSRDQNQPPSIPRDHSNQPVPQEHVPPTLQRPSVDHKPYSFEPVSKGPDERPAPSHQFQPRQQSLPQQAQTPPYNSRPSGPGQPSSAMSTPVNERHPAQWPISGKPRSPERQHVQPAPRQQPPVSQTQAVERPPQRQHAGSLEHSQEAQWPIRDDQARRAPGLANTRPYATRPPDLATSPISAHEQVPPFAGRGQPRTASPAPVLPPLDLGHTKEVQAPAQRDHQPRSPAHTASLVTAGLVGVALAGQHVASPTVEKSSSRNPHKQDVTQGSSQQYNGNHATHQSLGDLYDDYNNDDPELPGHSRDQEIEAEMPDFDSAAPNQTSMLHKRNQSVDQHINDAPTPTPPPPMPSLQSNPSVQSLPVQGTRAYPPEQRQQPDPYGNTALQNQNPVNGHGFDFGQQAQSPQTYQQDLPIRSPPPQQQGMPYRQGGLPMQPPQAPFATDPQVRRSLDDGRPMQHRQGGHPPPQRFHPNAMPGGPPVPGMGPLPPPQRPNMVNRSFSGNSPHNRMMDPQQRMAGAPPLRQGQQPNGAPFAQSRPGMMQPPQRQNNPDALPPHPTPVRPGLMEGGPLSPSKSAPVRNYDSGSISSMPPMPSQHQGKPSVDDLSKPITHAELDRLRAVCDANPNSMKSSLLLAKRLNEAGTVLASESGRADPKTTARNRERYIMDAYKRVKKLVQAGYPDAQFYLADCYSQGALGLDIDPKEAFNYYQAAAKQNHGEAAYRTAVCCEVGPDEGGGTRRDLPKAVQWYRRAAALGDVAAMYKLGIVLLKGLLGQPRQIGEAVTWLKRAAERADRDNPHALHELGTLYEPANTNPEIRNKIVADEEYACSLYQQAAALGYKFSEFRLGQAYEYGSLGLPIDSRASISYYSKAAAKGEHQAELALSGWYLTGADGILEHNDTEAYLWARKAAQSEPPLAKAMFAMGYFTEQGIGCPASLEEAKRWYGRAASYRFPKALERLEELKRGGKGGRAAAPANGKLMRKDQKKDEAECVVM